MAEKENKGVKLTRDLDKKKDYHEIAKDVMAITKNNFNDFVEFLGSYLEMNMEQFGEQIILNHLDNIKLMLQLKQIGIIKVKKEVIKK